jgi:hypothetical protein
MAINQNVLVMSFPTISTALNDSTDQYKFVTLSTAGNVAPISSSNVTATLGVLVNTPTSNEPAAVQVAGVCQVRFPASTMSAGDLVAASSVGLGVPPSTDAGAQGRVVYGSSGGARLMSVLLIPGSTGVMSA